MRKNYKNRDRRHVNLLYIYNTTCIYHSLMQQNVEQHRLYTKYPKLCT